MSDRCSSSASTAIQRLSGMAYGVAATSSAGRRSRIATSSPASSLRLRSSGEIRAIRRRSEEHTSELQSQSNLVCRPLLEKNKTTDLLRQSYYLFITLSLHDTTHGLICPRVLASLKPSSFLLHVARRPPAG